MRPAERAPVSARFPTFPWDTLLEAKRIASAHPDGLVDLSIGTPVDPTPALARQALIEASDAHGYPTVLGPAAVRQSAVDWLQRIAGVTGLDAEQVLLSIGSKELIANLGVQLGFGPDHTVVYPEIAYPTYDVAARYAGSRSVASDEPESVDGASLVFINTPGNPHGAVTSPERMRELVAWARDRDVLLVSDECYLEFGWETQPVSILHPDVCGGRHDNLLALHSTSKRSNLAGYRAAFVAGDRAVVAELLAVRKHLGFMVPTPIQHAFAATFADDSHVEIQRELYRERRSALRRALEQAGFGIEHSEAGLYLWATRGESCHRTIAWLAERGILAAPGSFYGAAGDEHVRVTFMATPERVASAVARLTS